MNNRELLLKTISNDFARWQVQIANLNSLNLYDANIFSEYTLCEILNTIFDYSLQNLNSSIKNQPAIDLGDSLNRIAVQVTSTRTKAKIQATLDKFFEHSLDDNYDELIVIILGNKPKSYSDFNLKNQFSFDNSRHILDFKDLLKLINLLPLKRLEKISSLLELEAINTKTKKMQSNASRIKRNLALKKKLKKDLLRELAQEHWSRAIYDPSIRFSYHNTIIRSVDDKSWPIVDEGSEGRMSSWFKTEFWNFYDNGLEFIEMGGKAIFNEEGCWDILNWREDKREENNSYKVIHYQTFLRIPFDYIVEYDMDPDPYESSPTIYVQYAKDGMPYEEILYGIMGKYDKDLAKCNMTEYFDNNKRKTLP